jgi:hypothetical protein
MIEAFGVRGTGPQTLKSCRRVQHNVGNLVKQRGLGKLKCEEAWLLTTPGELPRLSNLGQFVGTEMFRHSSETAHMLIGSKDMPNRKNRALPSANV